MSKQKKQAKIRIDGDHAHDFQLVFYDGALPEHVHPYKGETSYDFHHYHRIFGVTAPAPTGVPHVHKFEGTTTFDDGHKHNYAGVTGPAIPLPDGSHYHILEGETTVDARPGGPPHAHSYWGITEK
ncbi:YmaF family protein [Numidum massiliense]|uniref:YmaF family protein n=1 Tax=Numidum massiliense TaxID=1522315 RepID=UPI001E2F5965|nr:YmaF family protein [Numidum massiliense]